MTTDLNTPLPAIQIDDGPRYFVAHLGAREERMTLAHLLAVLKALTPEQRRAILKERIFSLSDFPELPEDEGPELEPIL